MSNPPSIPEHKGSTPGRSLELISALNAAAAILQHSIQSEQDVFRAFSEQISALGLRGGLSLLDETGNRLIVQAVAQPPSFAKLIARVERIAKIKTIGYAIPLDHVPMLRQMIETRQPLFIADSGTITLQLIPKIAQRFARQILRVFGASAVIYVPLLSDTRVIGALNIAGKNLLPIDMPAVEAFANHISIALTHARLVATLRQTAEERLQFSLGIERSSDAIFLTRTDGVITYVNPAFEYLYGYAKDQVIGQTPRILKSGVLTPEDYQRLWQTLLKRQVVTGEFINRTKNGSLITVKESANPIVDAADTLIGFLAIHHDITERKRAEQQLRQSEEQYRLLFEHNPNPMWVYDIPTLAFLAVNETAVRAYGYSRDEFLAMTIKDIRPPEDVPALVAFTKFNADSHITNSGIWRHRKKDGALIAVEITSHKITFDSRPAKMVLAIDVTERIRAEEKAQRAHQLLIDAYDSTLAGWARALEIRDKETEGHAQRVVAATLKLACALGIGDEELVNVRRGTLLHDIGKLAVPDRILLKPGPLTDDEWQTMRMHPVYAYELLSPIEYLRAALDIPYCHHEKWDGTGYPRGIKGEEIPLVARIFAVIDVWDALGSDRPYSKAWEPTRVLEHIRAQAGKHFDPAVVAVFLEQIP